MAIFQVGRRLLYERQQELSNVDYDDGKNSKWSANTALMGENPQLGGSSMPKTTRVLVFLTMSWLVILTAGVSSWAESRNKSDLDRIIAIGKEDNRAMKHVGHLVNDIGSRPANSLNYLRACKWAQNEFARFGLTDVHLERCREVPADFPDEEAARAYRDIYNSVFGGQFSGEEVPVINVVADIPGVEIPDEYIIVGAHLDCIPQGPGATDNGTGVAAVMEAARIISASGVQPKRTIRFILFGGEEVGLIGSKGYVNSHPEILSKISAVYVMDHGTNYISGIQATKPLLADMNSIFKSATLLDPEMSFEVTRVDYFASSDSNCCAGKTTAEGGTDGQRKVIMKGGCAPSSGCGTAADPADLEPLLVKQVASNGDTLTAQLMLAGIPVKKGATPEEVGEVLLSMGISLEDLGNGSPTRKVIRQGGSDNISFLQAGIPAFWLTQVESDEVPYLAHTAEDSLDKVIAPFLEHSALVLAVGAYETANLNHMLSRERLLAPE